MSNNRENSIDTNNELMESYERKEIDSDDDDFMIEKVMRRIKATDRWKRSHYVVGKDRFLTIYPFMKQYKPKQFAKVYRRAGKILKDSKYWIFYILILVCCMIISISHILLQIIGVWQDTDMQNEAYNGDGDVTVDDYEANYRNYQLPEDINDYKEPDEEEKEGYDQYIAWKKWKATHVDSGESSDSDSDSDDDSEDDN